MKEETRTTIQNKAYWKYQEMIALEMKNQWITMKQLSEHINIFPTKTVLHELFKDIHYEMHRKDTTRNMTREELSECLDVYMNALSHVGITLYFPDQDKKKLLEYYR